MHTLQDQSFSLKNSEGFYNHNIKRINRASKGSFAVQLYVFITYNSKKIPVLAEPSVQIDVFYFI